jgi:hypothetical protein
MGLPMHISALYKVEESFIHEAVLLPLLIDTVEEEQRKILGRSFGPCDEANYFFEHSFTYDKRHPGDFDYETTWCGPGILNFMMELKKISGSAVMYCTTAKTLEEADNEDYIDDPTAKYGLADNPNENCYWMGDIYSDGTFACGEHDLYTLYNFVAGHWAVYKTPRLKNLEMWREIRHWYPQNIARRWWDRIDTWIFTKRERYKDKVSEWAHLSGIM